MIKVIKIGGKLVENDESLNLLVDELSKSYPNCVLIHGGGSMAGQLATRLGIPTQMHEGRRITDSETLEVCTMAYAGVANKKIVSRLFANNIIACGLSGCDMGIVESHKREIKDIDWGFVGDVDKVNVSAIKMLLDNKILPVISAITCSKDGQLLNTNADSVAGAVAIALSEIYDVELVFCFDKPGVLLDVDDENSLIPVIDKAKHKELLAGGLIHSGMLPKLDNAFKTIAQGVKSVRLTSPNQIDGGTIIK